MKTITIVIELEDSKLECLKNIKEHCSNVLDDLSNMLGNEDGSTRIQIKTHTIHSEELSKNSTADEHFRQTDINNKDDLKQEYMLAEEAAEYLRTTTRKLALFRKNHLVKYSKFGKKFVYKKSWLDSFLKNGLDMISAMKIEYFVLSVRNHGERHMR